MLHWQDQKQHMLEDWFPNRTKVMLDGLGHHGLTKDSQDHGFLSQSKSLQF